MKPVFLTKLLLSLPMRLLPTSPVSLKFLLTMVVAAILVKTEVEVEDEGEAAVVVEALHNILLRIDLFVKCVLRSVTQLSSVTTASISPFKPLFHCPSLHITTHFHLWFPLIGTLIRRLQTT